MNFNDAINLIKSILGSMEISINIGEYDGLIVKSLKASNTLEDGRSTNQTHIAITGEQMDIFPYLRSEKYLNGQDSSMKKYYIAEIPVILSRKNIQYLSSAGSIQQDSDEISATTTVVRSIRGDSSEQIQVSLLSHDSREFIDFRKLLKVDDFLIVLKQKQKFVYEFYGVKKDLAENFQEIRSVCNQFYYLNTNTVVSVTSFSDAHTANDDNRKRGGENILYYGVPGSGKSFAIDKKIEAQRSKEHMVRVVFHPDYMSSDFIGQILPTVKQDENSEEKIITYEFTPGPFTRIMEQAYKDPSNMYYLVIEEINRGNAPAIFGEIFQLLDRKENGTSKYAVVNYSVARAMYGDENKPIRIPSNLTILATMNTSDQNVFTLDTAFQRR